MVILNLVMWCQALVSRVSCRTVIWVFDTLTSFSTLITLLERVCRWSVYYLQGCVQSPILQGGLYPDFLKHVMPGFGEVFVLSQSSCSFAWPVHELVPTDWLLH